MADLQTPATDVREIPRDRQPIYAELGYHPFQESEFAQGAGRCDKCGGGPDAEIHQKPIDQAEQLKRIADALEVLTHCIEYSTRPTPAAKRKTLWQRFWSYQMGEK